MWAADLSIPELGRKATYLRFHLSELNKQGNRDANEKDYCRQMHPLHLELSYFSTNWFLAKKQEHWWGASATESSFVFFFQWSECWQWW